MIQDLDDTLYRLFRSRLTTLGPPPPTADQIRLQPPDATWRNHVINNLGTSNALNVYLADVRENRMLRTNEPERRYDPSGRLVLEGPSPTRVDCHYLITAWSTATDDPTDATRATSTRTGEEHEILSEVASILLDEQPLVPAEIFAGSPPARFAAAFAEAELPTRVLPVDGFSKYAEFWGSMDEPHPWKPAVYVVVTIPIAVEPRPSGPPVTTLSTTYGQTRGGGRLSGNGETLITVGGLVLIGAGPSPAPGAWVQLLDAAGPLIQRAEADEQGRFRFERLVAGTYVFKAGSTGVGFDERTLPVPSPMGDYDLHLT